MSIAAGNESRIAAPAIERLTDEFSRLVALRAADFDGPGLLAVGLLQEGKDSPPEALVSAVMGLLPERLCLPGGFRSVVEVPAGPEGHERARSMGASAHLEARISVTGDTLLLTGVLRPAWVGFWTGETAPGESCLIEAGVRMDQSTRLLLRGGGFAGAPGGALVLREIATLAGRPIAIAVGDLTGDGRGELMVLLEDALVVLGHGGEGRTVELARRPLEERPRALLPARDPTGGVAVARVGPRKVIAYHHTGLAEGEVLEFGTGGVLRPLAGLREHPIAGFEETVVYGRSLPGTNLFTGPLRITGPGGARRMELEAPIFSLAIDPRRDLLMAVDHRFRLLDLSVEGKGPLIGSTTGAALTLAGLTGDGVIHRVGTIVAPQAEEDRLVITGAAGEVLELRPVPGSIRALATGDVTGRGRDEVAVLSHHEAAARIFLLAEVER